MPRIFELIYPAPLSSRVHSRQACTYLYRVMKFSGWIPPVRAGKRYVYLLWSCLVLASAIYVPIGFILNLIIYFEDFTPGEFLLIIQTFANGTGALLKTICGIIWISRQHETRRLLDQLEMRISTDKDRQKIHYAVALCNKIFFIYGNCFFAYTVSGVIAGVISGKPAWMIYNPFFDWRNGKLQFWFHLVLEYVCGSMTVIIDLVWDTHTLIYVTIFRAHLNILKDHIRKLRIDPRKTESDNYDELVGCIKEHKLILE